MAVDNQFKETVDALFKGMNGVVSSMTSEFTKDSRQSSRYACTL